MKKKKLSPLWLIPAVVIVALILWCIHFPLTRIAGFSKNVEPLHATVFFDQVPETPAITYATDDPEQLRELAEQLRSVRGRFMGWFTSITYNEDPLLHLIVVGTKGNKEYSLSLSADSDGYIYIQRKHTQLRAKDGALYDYLTTLVEKGSEEAVAKEVAADYVEKLSRVIYLYEDIDLSESTVLAYGDAPEMQYVVEKSEELKARRVAEGHFRTDWGSMYSTDVMEFSEDSATVLVWEDIGFRYEGEEFSSGMGNEYTVTLKKLNGEWLVSSVEGGDTYSLKEMETYQYRKAMPELYAQAGVEAFSFHDTLSVQVTNVIKTETRVLPAEDNFEYTVYTVLPGAEIEVLHAAVEDTVELGPLGIWKVYSKDGTLQYLESGMPNIPITENINGIGAESVCILVFELYTGEG